MNYLLHNLGYDKPVNFREIVLRQYHQHCPWLRDTYFDRLDLYDYEKWLPDLEYYKKELQEAKSRLKKYQYEMVNFTEEKLQEMYALEVHKVKMLNQCHSSYHMDMVNEIKRCTDEYNKPLQRWLALPNAPKYLTDELIDIYATAINDMEEHLRDEIKAVERMHNEVVPDYKDFKRQTKDNILDMIKFCENQVSDRKRLIKLVKEEVAEVKQIFAWLDSIEEDNEQC